MTLKNRSQRKLRGGQGQKAKAVVWQWIPLFKEAVPPPPPSRQPAMASLPNRPPGLEGLTCGVCEFVLGGVLGITLDTLEVIRAESTGVISHCARPLSVAR